MRLLSAAPRSILTLALACLLSPAFARAETPVRVAVPGTRVEQPMPLLNGAGALLPLWQAAGAERDALSAVPARTVRAALGAAAERDADDERERGERPDHPGELMRERWAMMTSGDTTITAQALVEARTELVQMDALARQARPFGALDAGLGDWEWLGPENVGGRTLAILFDPNDANHIWAGAASGGISTSFDGGASWSVIDDFLPSLSVTSLAIDTNTNYLYAGTGEFVMAGTSTGGGMNGAGIFRSTDFGATWTQLQATAPWTQVSSIAVVPADGFIFAATSGGLFRSSDSGISWSLVLSNGGLLDVKATPTSHLLLVGSGGSAFRSTDSGATWTTLTGAASGLPPVPPTPPGGGLRTSFAIAANQTTCFASVNRNGGEVWRSLDAGATWTKRSTGTQYLGGQGWYANAIWVDPTNANVVAVGGLDVWRSTDGGASFAQLSDWWAYPGASAHADHHTIVSPPNYNGSSNRRLYFGNDGGIQRKDDILAGNGDWTDLSNGLRSSQFYKGAIQSGTNDLLGGLQDNGTWRRTGSNNWQFWKIGDGGYCSFDASGTNQYFEYVNLVMYKNGIFGQPDECTAGLTDAHDGCNSLFIAPFKADPVVPGRLFAGGSSLWRSTNSAASWTSVRGPLSSVVNTGPGCPIIRPLCSTIELVASNPQLVWVGYTNGTVSSSTDNGATWTNFSIPALSGRFITDIAVNPSNTNEVWVTSGGFNADNVWFTSNGGTTWSNRAGTGSTALPSVPVETITMHPSNRSWIYAGTSLGVLASQDKGVTWGLMRRFAQSEGPAYTQVSDLIWEGNRLIAFTYGRGVYRSGPIGGTSSGPAIALLGTSLPGASSGSCDWGDFDRDGDLDVVWTGNSAPSDTLPAAPITRVGINVGAGNFSSSSLALPGVTDGAARWGDIDRDGDLDLALTGTLTGGLPFTGVYLNDGSGALANAGMPLEGVSKSDQVWGDFDNDGDLDLVVSGLTGTLSTHTGDTRLYRNDGGALVNAGAALAGVQHSSLDAGDYDNDGDLDLLLAGWLGSSVTPVTLLYRNDGSGFFTNVSSGLPNVEFSAEWGDYDMDGDLDMLLLGSTGLYVHRNNGNGTFTTAATLPAQLDGDAAWGDYDNDGDLDIAVTGKDGVTETTRLYRNDAGTFVDTGARLNGARKSTLAWGDFDNDGDVDLFLTGWANVANVAQVYRNDIATTNSAPWAPTGLAVNTTGCGAGMMRVTFSWGASPFDDHTYTSAMSYNLRIGTAPGQANVFSPSAQLSTGFRRVAARGNAQQRRSWTLTLPTGVYYWSVQSIDGAMKGSVFSGEVVARVGPHLADAGAALPQTTGAVAWGDYDGDDHLDLALVGPGASDIYRNTGTGFAPVNAGLPLLDYASSAWGDYDNDGDLDIVLSGCLAGTYLTRIYRNNSGSFVDIGAGLPGVCGGSVAWADLDKDGDLDLALTGTSASGALAGIYLNEGGTFYNIGAPLAGVDLGQSAWADYDNDGDPDLLVTGRDDALVRHTDLYRNDGGGAFVSVYTGLPEVSFSSVAWGDYDRDGDPDLLLAGSTGVGADQIARVYRNDGAGSFTDIFAGLPGTQEGSANWGDLDNDGRLDLLLTGYNPQVGRQARTFFGTASGTFLAATGNGLPTVFNSHVDLGDYDNDGVLDVALTGLAGPSVAKIFHSCGAGPNAAPAAPSALAWTRNGGALTLSWAAPADDHSPAGAGLTYNVRVGTTPGGSQIFSAMSNTSSGFHRLPREGNVGERLSWTLGVPDQRYYWSVQAVDAGYRASAFAAEQAIGIEYAAIPSGIPALYRSAVAWGDYDNDGDLDLLMAGSDGSGPRTYLYRNDAGTFVDAAAGLPAVEWCSLDWGDYDRDGDLDIAICGWNAGPLVTRIYRNDGGVFTDIAAGLPGVIYGTVAWGDADGDGDLDLFVAGSNGTTLISTIYLYRNGRFGPKFQFEGVYVGDADWGDYDNDGDMDLAVMGHNGTNGVTHVYRNDAGNFVDSGYSLPGAWEGSLEWGDYDADGDLDLLMVGWTGTYRLASVYRNADNLLLDIGAPLEGVSSARATWGDYDNDGDLDILATGYSNAGGLTRVYRKDTSGYVDAGFSLPGTYYSSVAWGDFDNDHDLDLALTGLGVGAIYRNDGAPANQPPAAPANLSSVYTGGRLVLSWSAATDDHTPAHGLSYNVRVGTTPGGNEIVSAVARGSDGRRKVARLGNSQMRLSLSLNTPLSSTYWSVQAIDGAFVGSAFAPEVASVLGTEDATLPLADALGPATPNPLAGSSTIALALTRSGPVEIEVFSVTGQRVATLFRGQMPAGYRTLHWEPRGEGGGALAAGVYLMRMRTPQADRTLKLVVMR